MMIKSYIFLASIAVLAVGCAGPQKQDRTMEELGARINDLTLSVADTREMIDELNTKFFLLQEKLEASRPSPPPAAKEAPEDIEEEAEVMPEGPPKGLKVVSLPAEEKPAPAKAAPVKKKTGPEAKSSLNKTGQTPEEMYKRGQLLLSSGLYADARKVFIELADRHPAHSLADNALYWAGETYYSEKDFASAVGSFRKVADMYPERGKAPDALLKVGYSYLEVSEIAMAREAFIELIRNYPAAAAAEKARKALAGLQSQ